MTGQVAAGDGESFTALPVGQFLDALAAGTPAPAGGSAAALAVAQSAALCAKAARLSARRLTAGRADELTAEAESIRSAVAPLIDEDPRAYGAVMRASRAAAAGSDEADLAEALSAAADVPMRVAEHAALAADLAASLAGLGNPALRGDAITAALLAEAGARAAATLVEINLADSPGDPRLPAVSALLSSIADAVRRARLATDLARYRNDFRGICLTRGTEVDGESAG